MSFTITPGKNCECIVKAERIRFLVDAEEYYHVLREAVKQAQKAVYIISWDIDSSLLLERDGCNDGYPVKLGEFLDAVAAQKPDLNIYILNWDFTVLFLLDRELLPIYKLDWKTHARVHFQLFDQIPSGASQHQKIVVIDDTLAFVGGLDLAKRRWDTPEHLPANQKRDFLGDKPARPHHDVQMLVAGECAAALGAMVRENWFRNSGRELPVIEPGDSMRMWPEHVAVDMTQVPVGISYTRAKFGNRDEKSQIQQMYTDAIASARKFIYIENQYFTTPVVGDAIKQQLEKADGPEIIIVMPECTDGWLSQYTMDVYRIRLIKKLRQADKYDRLHVYFPDGPGLSGSPINVHSKLMIVDDELATVGSANLNNRSMALDDECNIVVCSQDKQEVKNGIAGLRNRLLAEHLGCSITQVENTFSKNKSLAATISALNDKQTRFLNDLPLQLPENVDQYVPDAELLDPEHPIEMEKMVTKIIPEEEQMPARKRLLMWILLAVAVLVLAGLWRWTPLQHWVNIETVSALIAQLRDLPAGPVLVIACFVAAGLIAFPFTLLVIATVITFGSIWGFVYAMTGGAASAVITYGIGHIAGRSRVRRLAGPQLNSISRKLAKHGMLAVVTVRIIPVAPFTVVNLVAGASHIGFRDFLAGTLIGMAPGMLAITLLVDRVEATVNSPTPANTGILVAVFGLIMLSAFVLIKWLKKRSRN